MTPRIQPASLGAAASSAFEFACRAVRFVARFAKAHYVLVTVALVLILALAVVVIPKVIIDMPEDYFAESGAKTPVGHPVERIGKNVLGVFVFLIGTLLFIPPGAGSIFMVAGVVLMDFPGKRRLEKKAIRWRGVLKALNYIRRRGNAPPFRL